MIYWREQTPVRIFLFGYFLLEKGMIFNFYSKLVNIKVDREKMKKNENMLDKINRFIKR